MSHDANKPENELSRRSLLQGAALAGAAAVPVLLAGAGPASAKIAQAGVNYQSSPHGSSQCGNCKLFIAPSSCKSVAGTISPNGWCKIWVHA